MADNNNSKTYSDNPFELSLTNVSTSKLLKFLILPFEKLLLSFLGINNFKREYTKSAPITSADHFMERVLSVYNISYKINAPSKSIIPKTGPLIVVCNHPFGGVEPVIVAQYLKTIRPDVKIMANFVLSQIKALEDICIMVDPFNKASSHARNLKPLREAKEWLDSNGVLIIFPAGTVSYYHTNKQEITDPAWNKSAAKLALSSNADVISFFIHGRNSYFFQFMGLVHPILRTALLGREIINKKNQCIQVQHSPILPNDFLNQFDNAKCLTDYLRFRCYLQKNSKINPSNNIKLNLSSPNTQSPIDKAQSIELMLKEINALSPNQRLVSKNKLTCFYALANQIPTILKELGRLREKTFREVDEGTGKFTDTDQYDLYYEHLFIWDEASHSIVGAYRIGRVDEIIKNHGLKGLYSYSLFQFDHQLIHQLGSSLELGRSFICKEYQKSIWPLTLLWKGIGQYILQHSKYNTLFGTVSISSEYSKLSRQIIETYLLKAPYKHELSHLVSPRIPNDKCRIDGIESLWFENPITDLDHISQLMSDIELKNIQLPILLKEYIKLGGKLLSFNIDLSFNQVLDGFICVDLLKTPPHLLRRYLGKNEYDNFIKQHRSL